jgi:sulfur carrier protein
MITLNGEPVEPCATLAELIARLKIDRPGVAAAKNGEVIRRADWSTCTLQDGDAVEIVVATQGG